MRILKKHSKRLAALALCAVLLLGALPLGLFQASAAGWSEPYMGKLQEWGVMRGDGNGNMNPNAQMTRAEMVAFLNRGFGFNEPGPISFTDVQRKDWFYNDIAIGKKAGIFNGTSATTAEPLGRVTREMVLALISRCLRLEESPGEVTEFTDGRQFSSWCAPYVRSAMLAGIISGRGDGTFRPGQYTTRGEMAKMLAVALGDLVNKPGLYEKGGVFGNVTINTSGVTLKDTTIAGDLYISGGLGLGDVVLDNVKVLGRIVVAGGGESQDGRASIVLNGVEAHEMLVDPATGQYVSLRAIGSTNIPKTTVKSNAFIQDDVRDESKGLREVFLEAGEGASFTVAGNFKTVTNKTPGSVLTVGDTGEGSGDTINVDEKAVGSQVVLEINSNVDHINLDTATKVTGSPTGEGDIGELTVNTNGSSCDILPDKVIVRPGVITNIAGMEDVDSEKAQEISQDPRLLAGYPKAKNIAPTSADAVFSTNKAGTVYWALTTAGMGPLNDRYAESMISPSYGAGFLQNGSIPVEASHTELTASLTGLDKGGTYYISALLVDAHGRRSPVKAQEILTPDDSTPAMAPQFPTLSDRTPTRDNTNIDKDYFELVDIEATVMATKSCDLYYVLLPGGSTQPQTSEFLSHSFPDPYGYGRVRLIKNAMDSFQINNIDMNLDGQPERLGELEENKDYDLYLWLTDADGTKSSNIIKVPVKTKDITPPRFNMDDMIQTDTQATSVRLTNSINEDGTVYWVVVKEGADYPIKKPGVDYTDEDGVDRFLNSEYAKLQVINGQNGLRNGQQAARADTDFNLAISGLERESSYDVYYVAVDKDKNCSDPVKKFTIHTLDETPPRATQEFTSYQGEDVNAPYADTDIRIVFNENIIYKPGNSSENTVLDPVLLNMYRTITSKDPAVSDTDKKRAREDFLKALSDMIILYDSTRRPVPVKAVEGIVEGVEDDTWVVNYENVRVTMEEDGSLVVTFPTTTDPKTSALNLQSGATYFFLLQNIADNSERHNVMGRTTLPQFTTVSAEAVLRDFEGDLTLKAFDQNGNPVTSNGDKDEDTLDIPIDMAFTVEPRSTNTTADSVYWDLMLWFDTSVEFELYTRVQGNTDDPWLAVGSVSQNGGTFRAPTMEVSVPDQVEGQPKKIRGASVIKSLGERDYHYINEEYKPGGLHCGLNDKDGEIYEYAIHVTRIGTNTTRSTFSQLVKGYVTFVTGASSTLNNLANNSTIPYETILGDQMAGITNISNPRNYEMEAQFSDGLAPKLVNNTPIFTPTDSGVTMTLQLDRVGEAYYVLAPLDDSGAAALAPMIGTDNVSAEKLKRIAGSGSGLLVNTADDSLAPDDVTNPGTSGGVTYAYNGKTLTTNSEEPYYFTRPNSLEIYNPRGSGLTSPMLVTGSELDLGTSRTPVEIDGLAPDTTYYVYLITKGVSDIRSEVMVYQFKTKPITRPVITLRSSGSNITISSDINANVDYMVVPYSTAMDKVLSDPYVHNSAIPTPTPDPSASPMPVYEAMGKNVVEGTASVGSWFDMYAQQANKDNVADYIRTTQPNGSSVMGTGSGYIEGGKSITVECAKDFELLPGVDYCFLVVGRNPANSGDAFRATYPFQMADSEAPVIDTVNNTLYAFQLPDETKPNSRWYIGGTLRLTFNEPLCYLQRGTGTQQTLSKVTNQEGYSPSPSPSTQPYISTDKIVEQPLDAGVKLIMEKHTSDPVQAVSITVAFSVDENGKPVNINDQTAVFNCSPDGSSVTFFPGLSDEYYNARMNNPLSIAVSVNVTTDAAGNKIGTPVITIPQAWMRAGLNPNVRG